MHNHHFQHYALDDTNALIEIHNTDKSERSTFRCPYCKQELIAKRGKKNEWHFAHKENNDICSYENYLHTMAENKILEWYNNSDEVWLTLPNTRKCCDYKICKWYNDDDCCAKDFSEPYNLKKTYQTAVLEKTFSIGDKIFRADICLCSDKCPNDPIFIEVCVTHRCTEEKLNSGIRIIELDIQSEKDVEDIVSNNHINKFIKHRYSDDGFLNENIDTDDVGQIYLYENKKINYYGFKPRDTFFKNKRIPLQKFIIFSSKKRFIDQTNCREYQKRRGDLEITSLSREHTSLLYSICLAKAVQLGVISKICKLCRYMTDSRYNQETCNLSYEYGTNLLCRDNNDGIDCKYFRVNNAKLNEGLNYFQKLSDTGKLEIWRRNDITINF